MDEATDPLAAERAFFASLLNGGTQDLERLLADDFLLIDVMRGSEVTRADLLAAIGSGQLRFKSIETSEARLRLYGTTAVVTGRTRMNMLFGEAAILRLDTKNESLDLLALL